MTSWRKAFQYQLLTIWIDLVLSVISSNLRAMVVAYVNMATLSWQESLVTLTVCGHVLMGYSTDMQNQVAVVGELKCTQNIMNDFTLFVIYIIILIVFTIKYSAHNKLSSILCYYHQYLRWNTKIPANHDLKLDSTYMRIWLLLILQAILVECVWICACSK